METIKKTFYLHLASTLTGVATELENAMNHQVPELRATHYIVRMQANSGLPRGDMGITVDVTFAPKREPKDTLVFEVAG